jgi:hypothetical protein
MPPNPFDQTSNFWPYQPLKKSHLMSLSSQSLFFLVVTLLGTTFFVLT